MTASTNLSGIPNPLLPDSRQTVLEARLLQSQRILPKTRGTESWFDIRVF